MIEAPRIELRVADIDDAETILGIISEAFRARPPVDPPADALNDTVAEVSDAIRRGSGIIASIADQPVGTLLISAVGDRIGLHRVCVLPSFRGRGIAAEMVRGAVLIGVDLGARRVQLAARSEFPELIEWWRSHGFEIEGEVTNGYLLSRPLPTRVVVPTADDMRELGVRLAKHMRAGDVLIASGDLGAGKTTIAQGIGLGLGVDGPVISPTFVLSRVHPNSAGGPALVHVDAYRLGSAAELEDIDLESSLAESVTLVEWGAGIAEWLADDRLEIDIVRGENPSDETREVYLTGYGRWNKELEAL